MSAQDFQYDRAGVDTHRAKAGLSALARSINGTLSLRDAAGYGRPAMGLGYYANVLELPGRQGLAISTDGVGTKLIVAQLAGRYDTVGIDLIAMNVNDVICVGAEPFAMVDYIAVGQVDEKIFDELGRGLLAGAKESGITIPGGEIAQIRELIQRHGDSTGLDLVGTAVGLVPWDEINVGRDVVAGDVIVGLASNGLHSNGYTLARRVLLDMAGLRLDQRSDELGHSVADELLRPTRLYVKPVLEMLRAKLPLHALLHITGDGFCNINRIRADVGFVIDKLPAPGAVFQMIQRLGKIDDSEMFSVFNMGIGFCIVTPTASAQAVVDVAQSHGIAASVIGHATGEHKKKVRLAQYGLIGGADRLAPEKR
jgi:phosphoribosylformylglycinamidine cyclo-ligase